MYSGHLIFIHNNSKIEDGYLIRFINFIKNTFCYLIIVKIEVRLNYFILFY